MPEPHGQDDPVSQALSLMERVFGFPEFRPGQQEILESVLSGDDALVIMPTGGGKSLCFQVPAFLRSGTTLVISPLIALMKDQVDTLGVLDLPITAVHSLMGQRAQEEALKEIATGHIKLVYASPERLRNRFFIQALRQCTVSMVAVDEAHCISQWGHDFRPDYLRISQALEQLGRPQTIALTATATEKVRADIVEHLGLRAAKVFVTGFDRRNLFWEVLYAKNEKEKQVVIGKRLRALSGAAIIYTGTRKKVEATVARLKEDGFKAEAYHAGLDEPERTRVQDRFMEGCTDLVVATNAFGMGIDRADIRMVIHHTFPGTIEAYYQEGGRAGRDGEAATCLLLYSPSDRRLQEFFIEARYPPREDIFAVYKLLRGQPQDLLWLTYREIAEMGNNKISEMAVGSCVKILEDAGALKRLRRYDKLAELYMLARPQLLLARISSKARAKRQVMETLIRLYGEVDLMEGVQFLPHELAARAGITADVLRRTLSEMDGRGEATYVPPFRGRGLRILHRVPRAELDIDFETLQARKAYELEKLDRVMAYASSQECRRTFLLRYFGETLKDDRCHACDVCQRRGAGSGKPVPTAEPIIAVKVLSGIARLNGRFGLAMAAKVLTGSRDRMVLQFGLHRLSTYGLLSGYTQDQVQQWIKELIAQGCAVSRRTSMREKIYPVLELTSRGRAVMTGKEEILVSAPVREVPSLSPRPGRRGGKKGRATEKPLSEGQEAAVFEGLRQLRSTLARKEGRPAYCIFQDRTLKEMARRLPKTPEELLRIVGVGEVTLGKYGSQFLEVIQKVGGSE
ncbi:MAG: RecQ family ATP-dependent DNA helicase [Thermodesulfobacteriota bacterium]|nr:RecQ family ATP-dependent DNA helicase [Thermodesulfobacteriota bacterium]